VTHAVGHEPPPEKLGRYRVIGELGSGGMAHVYLGVASGIAGFTKLVVLKVMRPEWALNANALNMFLAEARLAARLHHPNIVQTLEVGEDGGRYFIGMEYLEGMPLGTLMARAASDPLPLGARLEIACQVLDGLSYLHQLTDLDGSPLGLVHQDISPSNIFVTFDGVAKVLDFGVAKAAGLTEVSVAGSFIGKIGYAAPEQMAGESDARSDVFAMGLVLWELLSGLRLNLHRTQSEIFRSRIEGVHVQLMRSRGSGLPAELLEICIKAAASDATERYSSASALRDALRGYMLAHSVQSSPGLLRELLMERFDEQQRSTRQRIDQRLKQAQRAGAVLSSDLAPAPFTQPPHVFVEASQRPAPSKRQPLWKRGLTVVLICALAGGAGAGLSIVMQEHQGVPPTKVVASPVLVVTGVPSASAAVEDPGPAAETLASTRRETQSEQGGEVLEVTDLPVDDGAVSAGKSRTVARRPRSSTRARNSDALVGSTASTRPDVDSAPAVAPPEAPAFSSPAPGNASDFVRSRKSTVSARPIDTVSPYTDE
jgi:serine/threonine-protein kinase